MSQGLINRAWLTDYQPKFHIPKWKKGQGFMSFHIQPMIKELSKTL